MTTSDCWHCSLKSYEVSYLTAETMHQFAGYILPGVIFLVLGLRWAAQLVWDWARQAKDYERPAGLPETPRRLLCCCTASLPWEGIVKLIVTGLGIIVSVIAMAPQESPEYVGNIRYSTIYLFFALSGLMDILVYYCGYTILPEGIQSFILGLAFFVEGVLFSLRMRFESYLEQHIHILLVLAIFSCSIVCIFEVLYDNRLIKFSRSFLSIVQGTWLIHGGFILQGDGTGEASTYPDSLEWVSILFTWHVASDFVLFITCLLLVRYFSKAERPVCCGVTCHVTRSSASGQSFTTPNTHVSSVSPTFTEQHNTVGIPPSSNFIQKKQLPALPTSHHHLSVLPSSFGGPMSMQQQQLMGKLSFEPSSLPMATVSLPSPTPDPPPVIVEALPKDNIQMSEEYRTLTREDELRQSIKLKESSLI